MASRVSTILTACAVALSAGAALAQAPDKTVPTVSAVTVQAAAPPKAVLKQAQTFVEAYTVPTAKIDQIGRWREPICVQVVNLPPEQAGMIKARVEEVAKGVGLGVLGAGCRSNIQIVLTGQPQAFVDQIAKNSENTLGFHWHSDLAKAKAVTHPIQGWYKTATQGSKISHDGLPFAYLGSAGGVPNGPGAKTVDPGDPSQSPQNTGNMGQVSHEEIVDLPENSTPEGCAGSLINHCLSSVFKNVLVVVDAHAVEGKDLGAVADYLAMTALSQAKSRDGCTALPSIFDLMAKSPCPGRDPPRELTDADATFLTALYTANPEARGASEQVEIAGRMAEALVKASAAGKAKN